MFSNSLTTFAHHPMKNFLIWFHARRLGIRTVFTKVGILFFTGRFTLRDKVILRPVDGFKLGNIEEVLEDVSLSLLFEDDCGISDLQKMNIALEHLSSPVYENLVLEFFS